MKAFFVLAFFLITTLSYAAPTITCKNDEQYDALSMSNGALFVIDLLELDCKDKNDNDYYVEFVGIGPGIRFSDGDFVITCPAVRKSKFKGDYYGLKVSAGAIAGATVGLLSNERLGVCTILGFEFVSLGASASIGRMRIE